MEDFWYVWVLPVVGGILWWIITSAAVKTPGALLQNNFASLGVLKGKTLQEIEKVCGKPNAISSLGNGQILRQWQATGYNIALLFDENDICLGISSEISV